VRQSLRLAGVQTGLRGEREIQSRPRRRAPRIALLGVWLCCVLSAVAGCDAGPAPPRNVLLVSVDTWRGDHLLKNRGGTALTPRLAAFAKRSLVFSAASSAGNATSPGMAGVLTGLLPRRSGVVRNVHRLQAEVPTLASTLRAEGFATAALVANPILAAEHGFGEGFERYEMLSRTRRQQAGYADELTRRALAWLDGRPADRPFLLWLHYMDPHGPYEPPADYRALFDAEQFAAPDAVPLLPKGDQSGRDGVPRYQQVRYAGLPPARDAREYEARYAAEVRFVDDAIGELLATMEARGWLEDTIVVLTSDHGEALAGDHGYWFSHGHGLTEDQVHVPLLLHCATCGPAATVDRPVSTIDVAPTVLALLGVPPRDALDGHDLLLPRPAPVVSQAPDATTIRDGRWKLTLRPGRPPALFDLTDDPREARDLAEEQAARVRDLQSRSKSAARPPLVQPKARDSLGPDELEALRVLGYVE